MWSPRVLCGLRGDWGIQIRNDTHRLAKNLWNNVGNKQHARKILDSSYLSQCYCDVKELMRREYGLPC
jgi:hypothetical protein